ncbi:MAG: sterol desaturase family protein [Chitinophagales bacterium]
MNYIALAIPAFFLLIGLELLIDKIKKTKYYRFNDAITNLSCGVGSQVFGVFLKAFIYIGYYFLYNNYKIFELPGIGQNYAVAEVLLTGFVLFLGVDFFYYWFHRLAHEINVLWGSHVVHHQSEEYNLTVALRQGWVQGAFSWMFYLPLAIVGFQPELFILINAFQTLYQFWIHTKAIDKLPRWFEFVFNTPSHHRVHHGVNPKYIDRNHGGTLIIYDRMFGTFEPEKEEVVYGITEQPKSWNPLWLNIEHWVKVFRDTARVKGLKNKWKMMFGLPGWKPEDWKIEKKQFDPHKFIKYDTEVPSGLNYYILTQKVLVLIGTTFFLFNSESLSWAENTYFALLIIWSLVNLGALFEMKNRILGFEALRLIVVSFTFIQIINPAQNLILAIVLPAMFLIVSLTVLLPYRNYLNKSRNIA